MGVCDFSCDGNDQGVYIYVCVCTNVTRYPGRRGCRDLSRVVFFASVNICPPGPREKRQLEQYASNKS